MSDKRDDEPSHDWDPEEERRRTDPREVAKEIMREAAKIQEEQEEKRDKRAREGLLSPAFGYAYPQKPISITLSVRKIRNGFVVVSGADPRLGYPPINMEEEYAKTPEKAVEIAARLVSEFVTPGATGEVKPPPPLPPGTYSGT